MLYLKIVLAFLSIAVGMFILTALLITIRLSISFILEDKENRKRLEEFEKDYIEGD